MMKNSPKHLAVLEAVAKGIGWGQPSAPGTAKGLAQIMGFGSYVAAAAEVSVSNAGAIKVHRIVAATNPGHVVNPDQVAAQVEGSFVYGLSAAFHQECTVKNGRIVEENFDTYPAMRMNEMPRWKASCCRPVISGAVSGADHCRGGTGRDERDFAATGKRVRSLPLKNADLRRA